jgi:phosphoribosylformylglycinamidine (FGAM) synthase-like amidotransferase family enzyme
VPVSHGEGRFYADRETLAQLISEDRVALRYSEADGGLTSDANPNGSLQNIAGILNRERNVLGMMPHPERACEELLGSADGLQLFTSAIHQLASQTA